jgi:predicted transcriptional regulator
MHEKPIKVEITSNLSEQEEAIIAFLKKNEPEEIDSGDIYDALKKSFAERTLRLALSTLEAKGMISAEKVSKGKGTSRAIKLKSKNN